MKNIERCCFTLHSSSSLFFCVQKREGKFYTTIKKSSIKRRIVMIHRICFHISCSKCNFMDFHFISPSFNGSASTHFMFSSIFAEHRERVLQFLAISKWTLFLPLFRLHSRRTARECFNRIFIVALKWTRSNNIIKVLRNQQTFRSRSFVLAPNPAPVFARFVGKKKHKQSKNYFCFLNYKCTFYSEHEGRRNIIKCKQLCWDVAGVARTVSGSGRLFSLRKAFYS